MKPRDSDFTAAAWISATATNAAATVRAGQRILYADAGGSAGSIPLALVGNRLGFMTGNGQDLTSTSPVVGGQWTHVAVTRRASTGAMAIYVNGTLDVTRTGASGPLSDSLYLYLGGYGGLYYAGAVDELALFTRVLSPTEIANLVQRGALQLKFQARACPDSMASIRTVSGWPVPLA